MPRKSKKSEVKKEGKIKDAKPLSNYELSKNSKSHFSKKLLVKMIVVILALLVLLLVFEILVENGIMKNPFSGWNDNHEIQQFSIKDSCSVIAGQLIHTILSEDECGVRCKTNCELRALSFESFDFALKSEDCHVCNCYCK